VQQRLKKPTSQSDDEKYTSKGVTAAVLHQYYIISVAAT
jgi:hypothetical protein